MASEGFDSRGGVPSDPIDDGLTGLGRDPPCAIRHDPHLAPAFLVDRVKQPGARRVRSPLPGGAKRALWGPVP